MEVVVLASGSSGNALVVAHGDSVVLVDAGISALQVRTRMAAFGLDERMLTAIVVTHEHSDHCRGVDVLARRLELPVWATAGTWSRLDVRAPAGGEVRSGRSLRLGDLTFRPVATSHDAAEPVALVIENADHRIAVCTDTGVVTPLLEQRLADLDLLLLEANHDADILRHGPYPWVLKQRIASRLGHLGNHQTAEALVRLVCAQLQAVVGLHLSGENNCPTLVRETLRAACPERVVVDAVPRDGMLRVRLGATLELEPVAIPPSPRRAATG
jgi:phosphoribosyl 1,2-cyclic phosphodiesterase